MATRAKTAAPKATRADAAAITAQQRADGAWQNLLTGRGVQSRDRSLHTTYVGEGRIGETLLEQLYTEDGIARRVIELPVMEMTREWFEVKGDPTTVGDNVTRRTGVVGRLEEIGAKEAVRNLLRWAGVYGGAIAYMRVDDGQRFEEPLDETRIQTVDEVMVYDRFRATVRPGDIYRDPELPKYGLPQWYTIRPLDPGLAEFRVHESRCLRMDGLPVPPRVRIGNLGWGDSVYQAAYTQLKHLGVAYAGTADVIEDFIQVVLRIKNLANLMATGRESVVTARLNLIDLSRSMLNSVLLDEGEGYEKHASSVAGLPDLVDRFGEALAAVTGIPLTLLLGRSPGGMNATGESDTRFFYDRIAAEQEDRLRPVLERLVRLVFLSKEGPTNGREPENWELCFKPLWQMSESEEAEIYAKRAQADSSNVSAGILDADEVANARYAKEGGYAGIEIEERVPLTPAELTAARQLAPQPPPQAPPVAPMGGDGAEPVVQ